jgi:hypothetical protein
MVHGADDSEDDTVVLARDDDDADNPDEGTGGDCRILPLPLVVVGWKALVKCIEPTLAAATKIADVLTLMMIEQQTITITGS